MRKVCWVCIIWINDRVTCTSVQQLYVIAQSVTTIMYVPVNSTPQVVVKAKINYVATNISLL